MATLRDRTPFVSVIVPVFNGEKDLPDLLDCLVTQTYPVTHIEFLIVDNNSRDRTANILRATATEAKYQGWQITPLKEVQIQSSYAARNTGIRQAQGEILVFTDADCRPRPDWLENLVQKFEQPFVGLVVGEIQGLPSQNWLERYAESVEVLSQRHTLENQFCPYGQTANLAVRRDVIAEVGMFRPYLTTGGDADFCWRVQRESNWQLDFAENAVLCHRHRSTLQELRSQWRRYGRSNYYLHELYGVELMPQPKLSKRTYLLGRWLAKEVPQTLSQMLRGQTSWVALLKTPINIYCNWQRFQGQSTAASLGDKITLIDRL